MSLKRCRALPVVAIVALVASGVIMFIWSQQRRLIYFPSAGPVPSASSVLPAGRDVVVETQDGMRLGGWYFPHTSGGSGPAVLVCNGNAGDRSMRAELAVALHGLGLSVLLFDYRGYGGNPGRRLSRAWPPTLGPRRSGCPASPTSTPRALPISANPSARRWRSGWPCNGRRRHSC